MLTLEACHGEPPGVEVRPECVLGVPQSGRTAPETSRPHVAGAKAVLSPAQKAENPCLRGHEGGIQARRRGWAPSIWEMSV